MNKLRVLVTNDDGPTSPAVACLAQALLEESWCSALDLVIPDSERSWIAQAVTRFAPLNVRNKKLGSLYGKIVSGTPADCSSLGIHNLSPETPDLVVSGPNMGINAGLPFHLSSGTIGGAVEGFLSGVPAAAMSINLPHEVYLAWCKQDLDFLAQFEDQWQNIAREGTAVVRDLLDADAWANADIISVNLPWDVNASTMRKFTRLKRGQFGALFQEVSTDCYQHKLQDLVFYDDSPKSSEGNCPTDLDTIRNGDISITLIEYAISSAPSDTLRDAIEGKRKTTDSES